MTRPMQEKLKEGLAVLAVNPVQWDCPLAPFTSFGIGGPADAIVKVDSGPELGRLLQFFTDNDLGARIIGKGSNLLVSDEGFAGVILLFGESLSEITLLDESSSGTVQLRVGAGCSMAKLLNFCTVNGYSGLEFCAGIPGSLGGAVVMNAGAWGGEIADVIASLAVYSLQTGEEVLTRKELDFRYRLWKNQGNGAAKRIVLAADILLQKGDRETIQKRCRKYLQQRKIKQPKIHRNAGSFFKNPPGDSAGRLIEASGLKGKRCGGAMVSPVHANFLVNTGAATAADVRRLMEIVIRKVKEESGIELQPEVHFL